MLEDGTVRVPVSRLPDPRIQEFKNSVKFRKELRGGSFSGNYYYGSTVPTEVLS
jgi:hypothetical protein